MTKVYEVATVRAVQVITDADLSTGCKNSDGYGRKMASVQDRILKHANKFFKTKKEAVNCIAEMMKNKHRIPNTEYTIMEIYKENNKE